MTSLKIGDLAPNFSLQTDIGETVSLSSFVGKKVVLYFYPKDDTPGCTRESCDFRDKHKEFVEQDAVILGISPDSVSSHAAFKVKYQLPFTLLVDEAHQVAERYGVWKEKQLYGRSFMAVERTTFVIDEHQKITAIFGRVQVDGHGEHVLKVIKGEMPSPHASIAISAAAAKAAQTTSDKEDSESNESTSQVSPVAKKAPAKKTAAKSLVKIPAKKIKSVATAKVATKKVVTTKTKAVAKKVTLKKESSAKKTPLAKTKAKSLAPTKAIKKPTKKVVVTKTKAVAKKITTKTSTAKKNKKK